MKRLGGCLLFVVVYIVTFFALTLLGLGGPNNSREAWAFLNHVVEMNRYMNREANPPLPEPLPPVSYSAASGLDEEPEPVASDTPDQASHEVSSVAGEVGTQDNETFEMRFPYTTQTSRYSEGETILMRRTHQLVVMVDFGDAVVSKDYTFAVDHVFDDITPHSTAQRVAAGDYASLHQQLRQQAGFHQLVKGPQMRYPVILMTPFEQAETLRLDGLKPDELKTYQDEKGQTWWLLYYRNHYLASDKGVISVSRAHP